MIAYARLRTRLIHRRRKLKLTQKRVAAAMGTTQSAVSDLETGRTKDPCMSTLAKWAYALDMELLVDVRRPDDDSPWP